MYFPKQVLWAVAFKLPARKKLKAASTTDCGIFFLCLLVALIKSRTISLISKSDTPVAFFKPVIILKLGFIDSPYVTWPDATPTNAR